MATWGEVCLKYLYIIFNSLVTRFWMLGMSILSVGLWLRFDNTVAARFEDSPDSSSIFFKGVYILIAVGALIMVVGFLGHCGAMKESQCMLGMFFSFLIVMFAVEVAAGAWVFSNISEVEDGLKYIYTQDYNSYKASEDIKLRKILHKIHFLYNCCGLNGPKDYLMDIMDICPSSVTKGLQGCTDAIVESFENQLMLIGEVGLGIGLVMVFGMVSSLCLCCAIRRSQ